MKKIRTGIIGLGAISHNQILGWLSHSDAEIVAMCDAVEARAKKKADVFGVKKTYTSYEELLKDGEIDAVDILLPHHLHADCAVKAAEAGKHVLLIKPMAMSSEDCDAVIRAAEKAGVKLQIQENYMFYPPFEKAKELIIKGEIGKPLVVRSRSTFGFGGLSRIFIEAMMNEGMDIPAENWRRDKKKGGGSILDDLVHHAALARWLMSTDEKKPNEFDSVFAFIPDLERENPSVICWTHQDGGLGNISLSSGEVEFNVQEVHGRYADLFEGYEVLGTKGMIWIHNCVARMINDPPLVLYNTEEGTRTTFEDLDDDWGDSLQRGVHHFIDCVINDKEPILTGEDGKKCCEFIFAVHKSAREGKAIKVGTVHELPF